MQNFYILLAALRLFTILDKKVEFNLLLKRVVPIFK